MSCVNLPRIQPMNTEKPFPIIAIHEEILEEPETYDIDFDQDETTFFNNIFAESDPNVSSLDPLEP